MYWGRGKGTGCGEQEGARDTEEHGLQSRRTQGTLQAGNQRDTHIRRGLHAEGLGWGRARGSRKEQQVSSIPSRQAEQGPCGSLESTLRSRNSQTILDRVEQAGSLECLGVEELELFFPARQNQLC